MDLSASSLSNCDWRTERNAWLQQLPGLEVIRLVESGIINSKPITGIGGMPFLKFLSIDMFGGFEQPNSLRVRDIGDLLGRLPGNMASLEKLLSELTPS